MNRKWKEISEANWRNARAMRRSLTPAEKKLWYKLRRENLGTDFRRQHPIGPYIVDFISLDKRLVIEVDGDTHGTDDQIEYDKKRTEYLEQQYHTVIRFTNRQVLHSMSWVLSEIKKLIESA